MMLRKAYEGGPVNGEYRYHKFSFDRSNCAITIFSEKVT